ncbi:hypothetical protein ScPMuIL_018669 [Solemya velum]
MHIECQKIMTECFAFNASVSTLLTDSQKQHEKLSNQSQDLLVALGDLENVRDAGTLNMTQLTTYNTSAQKLIDQEQGPQGIDADFHDEMLKTDQGMEDIKNTSTIAQTMQEEMITQKDEANRLQTIAQTLGSQLTSQQENTGQFQGQIDTLNLQVNELNAKMEDANAKYDQMNFLVNDTESLLAEAESVTVDNQANIEQASQNLTDCDTILDGSATGQLPINYTDLPPGVTSWTFSADQLQKQIVLKQATLATQTSKLTEAVQKSDNLTTLAGQLEQKFQTVESLGQAAVDAITNYESVTKTLNTSMELAKQANTTVKEAQNLLNEITVMDLATQAQESKMLSDQQRTEVSAVNYEATVLSSRLDGAQAEINIALGQWDSVKGQLQDLNSTMQGMQNNSAISQTELALMSTQQQINDSKNLAEMMKTRDEGLSTTLGQNEMLLDSLLTNTVDSTATTSFIEGKLKNIQDDLSTVQRRVNYIEDIRINSMANLENQVTQAFAELESRIQRARIAASKLNQPLQMDGTSPVALQNPYTSASTLHNYITIEFRKNADVQDALLAFLENPLSGAEFSVQLEAGRVVFEYNLNSEQVRINSPAVICDGCWFRVLASRYAIHGTLSVTQMSTGGWATTTGQGTSVDEQNMLLTSQLFVGGLPSGYQTTKVAKPNFQGCIYNVEYQSQAMNMWQKLLEVGGTPKCCVGPQATATPDPIAGVKFEGFGYLDLSETNIAIQANSKVYFQFRSFSAFGNIFLISSENPATKYSIGLENGRLVFEYGSMTSLQKTQTDGTYNNGVWYKVTVEHTQTRGQLMIQYLNQTGTISLETKTISTTAIDLAPLTGKDIVLGSSTHPQSQSYQESVKNFAGCIGDLRYDLNTGLQMIPRSMVDGIIRQKNVQLDGCLPSVISGIGFSDPTSFLSIDDSKAFNPLRSLSFSFMTSQPHGILLHARDSVFSDSFIHICLFNGNIFLFYGQARDTVKLPVFTTGQHFHDGELHKVAVSFTVSGTSLIVDEKAINSDEKLPGNNLKFQSASSSLVYIGGVTDPSTLSQAFPARTSLIGGIRSLTFNDKVIDLYEEGVLQQQNKIYLKGLMFGTTLTAYERFPADQRLFKNISNSFVLQMEVKPLSTNGILFYVADNYVAPNYWFSLFMEDGYFVVSMQTDKRMNETTRLATEQQYFTEKWVSLTVVRINNFLSIIVKGPKDYMNNRVPSFLESVLPLSTDIYVGGIGKLPFVGGIRNVTINTGEQYLLDLLAPAGADGTGALYKDAWNGLSLSGDRSFIRLVDGFSMFGQLSVNLTIRSRTTAANLFTLYQSPQQFITMDIMDGQIRCMVSDTVGISQPFIAVSQDVINICDTQQVFVISLQISPEEVGIQINNHGAQSFALPPGFQLPVISGQSVFIGGLQDLSISFPKPVSMESFKGCLQAVDIQGTSYKLRRAVLSNGVMPACPY